MRIAETLLAVVSVLSIAAGLPGAATSTAQEPPPGPVLEPKAETWVGHKLEELKKVWGEPFKVRPARGGPAIYHFKYRATGLDTLRSERETLSDLGVGPSRLDPRSMNTDPVSLPTLPYSADVEETVATLKARFWIDENGVVLAEEIGKVKWKKGHGPRTNR